MFFLYEHDDNPLITYFKRNYFKVIKKIPDLLKDDTIIYVDIECIHKILPKNTVNILLVTHPITDNRNINKFDYYLPVSPELYYIYLSDFKLRLLLPINIFKDIWNLYYLDDSLKQYNQYIQHGISTSIDRAKIIVTEHDSINSFTGDKIILTINKSEYKYDIFTINNYLSMCKKSPTVISRLIMASVELVELSDLFNQSIELRAGEYYIICRSGFVMNVDKYILMIYMNTSFNCISFLSRGLMDELVIFVHPTKTETITYAELLGRIEYNDTRYIGINKNILDRHQCYKMCYYYVKYKLYHMLQYMINSEGVYYELILKYLKKINCCSNQRFDTDKFIRYLYVWAAENSYDVNTNDIDKFINENAELFNTKNILLIGKSIDTYGGSQKTSLQIYEELTKSGFRVFVANIADSIPVSKIDRYDILQFNNLQDLMDHTFVEEYSYIIINKLDEMLDIVEKCVSRVIFITHNSMDPVNRKLLDKSIYLHKIFVVNDEHQSLFFENNIQCQVVKYINCIPPLRKIRTRTEFKQTIVYVGRISPEKNIDLLLDSFKQFNVKNNIQLIIIGDGKYGVKPVNNVKFTGKLGYNSILYYLARCDYLILPSSTEGCPFSILEAFNIGLPVVCSNIIGANELVSNGYNGFIFDYYQYDQFRNNIDNWDVINYNIENKEKNTNCLVECLNRAYNISIDKWNEISNNAYVFSKTKFDYILSGQHNINQILNENNLLLITDKLDLKYFDIKPKLEPVDVYKYNIILKIDAIKKTYSNCNDLVNTLYRIKSEMQLKGICKIIDKYGNYILILSSADKIFNVVNLEDFWE